MKKLSALFILISCLLFSSCEPGYFTGIYEYTYYNLSSQPVTFFVENTGYYNLESQQFIKITHNFENSVVFLGNPRIKTTKYCEKPHTFYSVYIENLEYKNMKFFNSSNYDIIISEEFGMLGDNYGDTLLITPGNTVIAKVYSNNPSFKAIYKDTQLPANNVFSVSSY